MTKTKVEDFCHLHTHSDHSKLDGAGKVDDYVQAAEARGHKGIALTEHGSMRSLHALTKATAETEVRPIYGIEFYVAPDLRNRGMPDEEKEEVTRGEPKRDHRRLIRNAEFERGYRDRWHLTVHAKNDEGLRNLFKLNAKAWLEGYYYQPRIDLDALCEHGSGLMVMTGCLTSPINAKLSEGKRKEAFAMAEKLHDGFGEDLWLEVQPHDIADQVTANNFAAELRKRWPECKLIATQDAHYVNEGDDSAHEVLLCIGTNSFLSNPDRFKFDGNDFYFRTRQQMRDAFLSRHELSNELVKEALDSTVAFAERCKTEVVLDPFKCLLPDPGVPPEYRNNHFGYLSDLCLQGWQWRDIPTRARIVAKKKGVSVDEMLATYRKRLKHELRTLRERNVVDYFLIVRDVYNFARENDIGSGAGRGSGAGCLVSFLIGITAADPIEHGLLFERFLAPGRVDMPDIDCDFEDHKRGEIISYLRGKYGEDHVAQIATISKLSGKQVVKDVCRVLEVPFMEANKITKAIIDRDPGDARANNYVEDSLAEFDILKKFNKKYPDVLKYASRLEGMAKGLGIHAGGVVTSPIPLSEIVPIETRKQDKKDEKPVVVTAVDMKGVQDLGLLKLDILGVRMLSVVHDARRKIKERRGIEIDLETLDLEDKEVLKGFTENDFVGVFQYDSASAHKICETIKFKRFEDIATLTALNRPGATRSGYAEKYVATRRSKKKREERNARLHPKVKEITQDADGFIVYQEHVIRIFREVAGYSPEEADKMRKKVGKRVGSEEMEKERHRFKEGCANHSGMSLEDASKLFNQIVDFGAYGFNKSHATAYGIVAFWCMYLKRKFPLEFYWSLLKHEPDSVKIQQIGKDAKKNGVDVLPPDVCVSASDFTIDEGKEAVRGSLVDIKQVGKAATEEIVSKQPFEDFVDFVERVNLQRCNKRTVESLLKAGALESLNLGNMKFFVENFASIWAEVVSIRASSGLIKKQRVGDPWKKKARPTYGLKAVDGIIAEDEEEMLNVRRAELLVKKGWGSTKIARFFNDRGITKRGRRWTYGAVDDVLREKARAKIKAAGDSFRSKYFEIISQGESLPDYTPEERALLAATVNPVALGMHPIEAYAPFIEKHVKREFTALDSSQLFTEKDGKRSVDRKFAFICGVIIDVKKNQVGDFHKGEPPDEIERARMRWGKQYANVNIEDPSGVQRRIKFDWDTFEDYRDLVEGGPGTPLIALCVLNKRYQSCRVSFAIDLEDFRERVSSGSGFTIWQDVIRGEHPLLTRKWKNENTRLKAIAPKPIPIGGDVFDMFGIVSHVRTKPDKRGQEMAWFGLVGVQYAVEVTVFGSDWENRKETIKPGKVLRVYAERQAATREFAESLVLEDVKALKS